MSENESIRRAEAMLKMDEGPGASPAETPAGPHAVRREQRRLAWLTAITVTLWIISVGVICVLVALFFLAVRPKLQHMADDSGERLSTVVSYVIGLGATLLAMAVGILAAAVLATLSVVFASRRATLRQVSGQLAEVTRELRQLRSEMRPAGAD